MCAEGKMLMLKFCDNADLKSYLLLERTAREQRGDTSAPRTVPETAEQHPHIPSIVLGVISGLVYLSEKQVCAGTTM
jgi:hypothetical protein